MTSESKILTVSYGTFSCTLEGFDNPFDTMKAIAEYFRDLAAQDRHFGAEPPPPDAAMLHRLAEREVSRLAASKLDDAARLNSAEAAEAPSPRIQINPVLRRPAPPVVEPEPQPAEDAAAPEPSLTDVIPDGVAAKLARIRKSVPLSSSVAEAPFAADPEISEPAEADLPDQEVRTAAFADDAGDVAARLGALLSTNPPAADLEDEVEEAVALAADLDGGWTDGIPDAAVASEAVLADATEDAALTLAAEEAPLPIEREDEIAAEAPALSILDDFDDVALVASADHPAETDFTAEDVALLAQLDGTVFDEDSLAAKLDETLPEDQPLDLDLTDVALQDPLPELVSAETSTEALPEELAAEDLPDAIVAEAVAEPVAEAEAEATALEPEAEATAPDALSGKAGARARRVNSRVVRIHPSEDLRDPAATRALDSDGDSSEVARLMQQAEEVMAEEANLRRQEALSRLKAAVAATEADRADLDYEAPKADANLDPYRGDLAEAILPETPAEPAPAPDVKPRRKSMTIRPAAEPRPGTIRPGMISPPPLVLVSEQRIDRVGPGAAPAPAPAPAAIPAAARATTPAAAPSMAPAAPGIAPPEGQPMVALRTGRLSGAIGAGAAVAATSLPARNLVLEKPSYGAAAETDDDEDLAEDAKEINEAGLASFAEMVGARSMAEMLEAAAAYATCVENRSQFTRPQLMRRMMASAGGRPVSREDGLRSFGTLLRTGRIEKVTRGHYSLAENSPYLAEARRLT